MDWHSIFVNLDPRKDQVDQPGSFPSQENCAEKVFLCVNSNKPIIYQDDIKYLLVES